VRKNATAQAQSKPPAHGACQAEDWARPKFAAPLPSGSPVFRYPPRAVQFVADLPKTFTGKIMRRELKTLDAGTRLAKRVMDLEVAAGAHMLCPLVRRGEAGADCGAIGPAGGLSAAADRRRRSRRQPCSVRVSIKTH
jgi:hypothetical protein